MTFMDLVKHARYAVYVLSDRHFTNIGGKILCNCEQDLRRLLQLTMLSTNRHVWYVVQELNITYIYYSKCARSFLNKQFHRAHYTVFNLDCNSLVPARIVRENSEIPQASIAGVYPVQNACSIKFHIQPCAAPPVLLVVVCIELSSRCEPDVTHTPPGRIFRSWNIYNAANTRGEEGAPISPLRRDINVVDSGRRVASSRGDVNSVERASISIAWKIGPPDILTML